MVAIHHKNHIAEERRAARVADRQLFQFALVMAVLGSAVMLLFTFSFLPVLLVWAVCIAATLIGMLGNHLRSRPGSPG